MYDNVHLKFYQINHTSYVKQQFLYDQVQKFETFYNNRMVILFVVKLY